MDKHWMREATKLLGNNWNEPKEINQGECKIVPRSALIPHPALFESQLENEAWIQKRIFCNNLGEGIILIEEDEVYEITETLRRNQQDSIQNTSKDARSKALIFDYSQTG